MTTVGVNIMLHFSICNDEVFSKLETDVATILQQSVVLKVLPSNIALRRVCRVFMLNIPRFFIPALCKFTVKRVYSLSSLPNAL